MSSLLFAVKFSMTLFLLGLHFGLALILLLSFIVHSGKSTEGVAIGVEAMLIIMVSIRLWYYWARYRIMTEVQRMRRERVDERVFVVTTWVLSLANAVWITVHATTLPDGLAGLPRPDYAAVAEITLIWIAWTIAVHLIWILVQEETTWMEVETESAIDWPSTSRTYSSGPYTPEPPRRNPIGRFGRISAKIIAVQHGSPPELWSKNKGKASQVAPAPSPPPPTLEPARPTYDPRARQMREAPPIKTSRYQWYITPGEAV